MNFGKKTLRWSDYGQTSRLPAEEQRELRRLFRINCRQYPDDRFYVIASIEDDDDGFVAYSTDSRDYQLFSFTEYVELLKEKNWRLFSR